MKQYVLKIMCVSILPLVIGQAKSKCTVLYYHLWPAWLYCVSPCYLKRHNFRRS